SVVRGGVGPDLLGGPVTLPHCSVWSTALQARPPGRFSSVRGVAGPVLLGGSVTLLHRSGAECGPSGQTSWASLCPLRTGVRSTCCVAGPHPVTTSPPRCAARCYVSPSACALPFALGALFLRTLRRTPVSTNIPGAKHAPHRPLGADDPPGHPGGPHRSNRPPACSATLHQKHPQGSWFLKALQVVQVAHINPAGPWGTTQPSTKNTSRGSWNLKALQVIQVALITLTGSQRAAHPPTKTPPEDRRT
ncbi:hypothetical protein CBL_20864, partial [Carabus blaptoides fortunei]